MRRKPGRNSRRSRFIPLDHSARTSTMESGCGRPCAAGGKGEEKLKPRAERSCDLGLSVPVSCRESVHASIMCLLYSLCRRTMSCPLQAIHHYCKVCPVCRQRLVEFSRDAIAACVLSAARAFDSGEADGHDQLSPDISALKAGVPQRGSGDKSQRARRRDRNPQGPFHRHGGPVDVSIQPSTTESSYCQNGPNIALI
jgi:hypothetical protein